MMSWDELMSRVTSSRVSQVWAARDNKTMSGCQYLKCIWGDHIVIAGSDGWVI